MRIEQKCLKALIRTEPVLAQPVSFRAILNTLNVTGIDDVLALHKFMSIMYEHVTRNGVDWFWVMDNADMDGCGATDVTNT